MNDVGEQMPRFGSDESRMEQLLAFLVQIRKEIDNIHEELRRNPPESIHFDANHYARIPRRQKKVWKYLRFLAQQHSWIKTWEDPDILDIEPSQPGEGFASKAAEYSKAKAIVDELQKAGIEAKLRGSFRLLQ